MSNMKPTYLRWGTFSACGIGGKSGSGKSSTLRLVLSQLAGSSVSLIVADGHGNAEDSLAKAVEPLQPAFLTPVITEVEDLRKHIKSIKDLMELRLNNKESSDKKIAFVIDEFTSFFMRLPKEDIQAVTKMLIQLSNEARKTNIRIFLTAHNWAKDYVGAAEVRRNLGSFLLHRLDDGEARLFLANGKLRQKVTSLKQGEALLVTQDSDPTKVYIPYISQDDLYTVNVQDQYEMREKYMALIRGELDTNQAKHNKLTKNIGDRYIEQIIDLHYRQGLGKIATIKRMFGVSQGGSEAYKQASKLYDKVIQKVEERRESRKSDI